MHYGHRSNGIPRVWKGDCLLMSDGDGTRLGIELEVEDDKVRGAKSTLKGILNGAMNLVQIFEVTLNREIEIERCSVAQAQRKGKRISTRANAS